LRGREETADGRVHLDELLVDKTMLCDTESLHYLDHLGLALEHLELAQDAEPNKSLEQARLLIERVFVAALDEDDEPELRLWTGHKA
jgi:hypothetical protein